MQSLRGGQNFSFPTLLDSYRKLLLIFQIYIILYAGNPADKEIKITEITRTANGKMGIKLTKPLSYQWFFSRAWYPFFVTLFNIFKKFKRLTVIVSVLDNMKFSCHCLDFLKYILKGHYDPNVCIITSSLKYAYLHTNLWTAAKIRQGLLKRELLKIYRYLRTLTSSFTNNITTQPEAHSHLWFLQVKQINY